MSRIGNKAIAIPSGVEVTVNGSTVTTKGPKGTLTKTFQPIINVEVKDNQILVTRPNEEKATKQLHGTTRAIVATMVEGVSAGYKKTLTIVGIGYRAAMVGKNLQLNVGYSHPVVIEPLEGATITCVSATEIEVTGCDKQIVGQVAAEIRRVREPEPYLGKGISYKGEHIRRKEGKKAGKK